MTQRLLRLLVPDLTGDACTSGTVHVFYLQRSPRPLIIIRPRYRSGLVPASSIGEPSFRIDLSDKFEISVDSYRISSHFQTPYLPGHAAEIQCTHGEKS